MAKNEVDALQAAVLWDELRAAFVNAERLIKEIIRTKAWEPLGYNSFSAAWQDRMQGVKLASDIIKVHVVYAMFNDDLAASEIAEAVGVKKRRLDNVRTAYDAGVPADRARFGRSLPEDEYAVREHTRRKPSAPQRVHIDLSHDDYEAYKVVAKKAHSTLEKESEKAIRAHFLSLARQVS